MKNNHIFYLWAMLTMAMPGVNAMHEAEESSWVDTTSHDDPTVRERDELQKRLQRSRTMSEHDWAFRQKTSIDAKKAQGPTDQPESTRVKFAPKKWTQRISDFFSNLFGDKATLDDRLLTHNVKIGDPRKSEDALTQAKDKELFKNLDEDQQEKSLNGWLKVERNKLEGQKRADEETYSSDHKKLEQARKDTKADQEKLIQQSNKAGDKISAIIRKFKKDYPDTDPAALDELTRVNNSILAIREKDRDIATNAKNQEAIKTAVEKLQALYKTKETALNESMRHATSSTRSQLAKELQGIKDDVKTLQTSLEEIQKNDKAIRRGREKLNQLQEKVETDNTKRQINTQEAFNRRLAHFRNEIQALLPANRELKYNKQTDQFEYHSVAPRAQRLQPTEDATVSSGAFRRVPDVADAPTEPFEAQRTDDRSDQPGEPVIQPRRQAPKELTPDSSPEEIQQQLELGKREFDKLSPKDKTDAIKEMFEAYGNTEDPFKQKVMISFLKSIAHDVPTELQEEYNSIVSPAGEGTPLPTPIQHDDSHVAQPVYVHTPDQYQHPSGSIPASSFGGEHDTGSYHAPSHDWGAPRSTRVTVTDSNFDDILAGFMPK